ncbi:MAG TPA: 4Fe-4S binding protein [Dehalococcoidia bacterium]|nr:4Fe-4S binding protein [Dehalococcoidia bacterium]
MCRMCDWLGDGAVWYKNPKNYANRMYKLREPGRKSGEFRGDPQSVGGGLPEAIQAKANGDLETFHSIIKAMNERHATQPGTQVVPLEDCIDLVMNIGTPLAAMHCICRKTTRGEEETNINEYSCLGLGTGMFKWERWPERYRGGVEFLSPKQTAEFLEYWDKRGMVHIAMQEGGDFIGGICNCDYPDCVPIRQRVDYGLNYQLVKGEYICEVDYEKCNGCGECLGRCQFNALKYESTIDKPNIDPMVCFGCGLCMTACHRGAIRLVPRTEYAVLRHVW